MITDIWQCHPYIEMLFHAMLAEHKTWKEIEEAIDIFYLDYHEQPVILEDDVDLAYLLKVPGKIILSISGTRDEDGWNRNAKFKAVDGWHRGFRKSFYDLIQKPLDGFLRKYRDPLVITGHSAGPAIGLNAAYYVRINFNRNCELIGFCAPQAVDRSGVAQCRKAKVCATSINIGRHDIVDNIGKIVGGKNYGYVVELPDAGDPDISQFRIADRIFFGHAPSYVCRSLTKLYHNWGKNYDKEIAEISRYAIK